MDKETEIAVRAAEHKALSYALGCEMSDERAIALALLELGDVKIAPQRTPFLDLLHKRAQRRSEPR